MKHLSHLIFLTSLTILGACSDKDNPDNPISMQPSAILSDDATGANQTFEYDDCGRIAIWTLRTNDNESVTAKYSYPDDNTIKIKSEETSYNNRTYLEETIQLTNGRASKSEGTFIREQDGNLLIKKTYRLEFQYDPGNHLTSVKHSEVMGIADDPTATEWNKPWNWENLLIWENGNLKEHQDFHGKSYVYQTTQYTYSTVAATCPVIPPAVINSLHHNPLFMQGVFGSNSINLITAADLFNKDGNLDMTRNYTYQLNDNHLVTNYTETTTHNTGSSYPISYSVSWTTK